MTAASIRARVRAEMTDEIKTVARRHLDLQSRMRPGRTLTTEEESIAAAAPLADPEAA